MLDFRNTNTLWCSILVETLVYLGLKNAIICPGSRSTPLTIAFARHPDIETIPILDERSAAFFALGRAKRSELPVALVCSSGTAGANFYPAVIEATETGVPLIILTADRPPELRHCHAGQTIDQIKLFSNYPNWYFELAIPEASYDLLCYLRQNIVQAWSQSLFPRRGVVHLNCPFREPLAPIIEPAIATLASAIDETDFFAHLKSKFGQQQSVARVDISNPSFNFPDKGVIISGLTQTKDGENYSRTIALLAEKLKFPVLAEALSPLRNYQKINPDLITTYDKILRNPQQAKQLTPETVIQIGELPTSKQLRKWLGGIRVPRYVISSQGENFDPLHGKTIHLRSDLATFTNNLVDKSQTLENTAYRNYWQQLESENRTEIDRKLQSETNFYEGKAAWLISQNLPPKTPIFFANSMTVRNAEFFWRPNNSQTVPYFNRGANGIDGTLSTALGVAQKDRPTVLLTGDLALLHDTNGFLIGQHFQGHLTIIAINNNGGGIFEILPIATFDPPFEEYFATPQNINLAQLCQTYNVEYHLVDDWQKLARLLNPLPSKGIRLLELKSDRKKDADWLKKYFWQLD